MKHEQDLSDLDALVLAEIESMERGHTSNNRNRPSRRPQPVDEPPRQRERPTRSKLARIHGEDRAAEGITGEEAEALFDEPLMDESSRFGDEAETSADSLFSAEEQAFMSRAVGFLQGRDNADMILGQIWEQLTLDHPDGFYTADQTFDSAPAQGAAADQAESGEAEEGEPPAGADT